MAGPTGQSGLSIVSTQKGGHAPQSVPHTSIIGRPSFDRDGQTTQTAGGRSYSQTSTSFAPRGSSLAPSPGPGSFSADMRSHLVASRAGSRLDLSSTNLEILEEGDDALNQQTLLQLKDKLNRELKIKEGSENLLEALNSKKAKQVKEQRARVESELNISNQRIKVIKDQIADLQRVKIPTTPTRARMAGLFQSSGLRSPGNGEKSAAGSDYDEPVESPTYALAEVLQALEIEGLTSDYYVEHANNLVELFKRHPTLKHDLVWSVFGLRMQVMLLSESREVVAAGFRMLRHAISDASSLRRIRSLHTDYLVVLSLIKERKADVEREQALKFVRAFLDVKDGVREISRSIVRTMVAIAESDGEDRLRSICTLTLAEIMGKAPRLLTRSGGMKAMTGALEDSTYEASEGLTQAFVYLLDSPSRRKYLRPGYALDILFTPFTDQEYIREKVLRQKLKAILIALKTWPGLMQLSMYNFRAIRSLMEALVMSQSACREVVIDGLFTILRIKPPSWSSAFLAGRRLTTYGRVTNLKSAPSAKPTLATTQEDETGEEDLLDHYTALLLAILITAGMMPALLQVTRDTQDPMIKRKTTLLIGEVLKLANRLLPSSWSTDLQMLPQLFTDAASFGSLDRHIATSTVYQIDSVSRTLHRSGPATSVNLLSVTPSSSSDNLTRVDDGPRNAAGSALDETTFRQLLIDSNVLNSTNYLKWKWEVILKIIEGPLLNGKRLDEAIKASKFIKRITSFYRPFKFKFAEVRNTKPNQKYVKVGCALMTTLLQTAEGVKYLSDNKLLRQLAECLAQCDPVSNVSPGSCYNVNETKTSGLTAQAPMFSQLRMSETLCSGYFALFGTLSSDPRGLQMLDRWRMINMMYHILDVKQRPDLIKLLLSNFDYNLHGHPRVLLSKALTAGTKDIRIFATNILRKYTSKSRTKTITSQGDSDFKWAVQLLVTQLYDPEVDVCATAIKILEEACNRKNYLEYIVECRPALDHLGEIGAPLLLRFLSTSIGYHYLDGLDYISNEMDDWFLGRNDTYVGVIEAVLARAFCDTDDNANRLSLEDDMVDADRVENDARVPPHFYRELARTKEGCKLLRDKGHFEEFATTIRNCDMQCEDPEVHLKIKGCMWAVGNVGSMDMGAPFLEETDVVGNIVRIAECHQVMGMRGSAFFVIGLISRSVHGLEILSEHGWDSNTTMMGESLGLCIPTRLTKFLNLTPWQHHKVTDFTSSPEDLAMIASAKKDDDPINQQIIDHVISLGNSVLIPRGLRDLTQLKMAKAPGFRSTMLFKKIMILLSCHHVKITARRVTVDLFEKSVMRKIVLDEESSDEESEDSDDGSHADTAK